MLICPAFIHGTPSQDCLRNTLATYQESMKSKKYKKRKTAVMDITHIHNSESTNIKYKTYVTCEITLHVAHIVNTE
jgi:hypothetical protein